MIETKRCRLFTVNQEHYQNIQQLYKNHDVRKYLGGIVNDETFKEAFFQMIHAPAKSFYWIINEKQLNTFIGLISLDLHHDGESTEISYQFLPNWWHKGYATEVVCEILLFGFHTLNLEYIVAETQFANIASRKLLEKVGMQLKETTERFGELQAIYFINK